MKVILKTDVRGLGRKNEIKEVSDGYANNFLIPKKMAEHASLETINKFKTLVSNDQIEKEIRNNLLARQMEMLRGVKIKISKRANDKGHLFEKINATETASALKEQANIEIDPNLIFFQTPIKEIGSHKVQVRNDKLESDFEITVEDFGK